MCVSVCVCQRSLKLSSRVSGAGPHLNHAASGIPINTHLALSLLSLSYSAPEWRACNITSSTARKASYYFILRATSFIHPPHLDFISGDDILGSGRPHPKFPSAHGSRPSNRSEVKCLCCIHT